MHSVSDIIQAYLDLKSRAQEQGYMRPAVDGQGVEHTGLAVLLEEYGYDPEDAYRAATVIGMSSAGDPGSVGHGFLFGILIAHQLEQNPREGVTDGPANDDR